MVAFCVVPALAIPRAAEGQVDTLWQYSSGADVVWMRLQEHQPQLLVNAGSEITALDTRSGALACGPPRPHQPA